ncbi:MAG: efflux RND transporter periplasmic adaptor subunit [Alloprevotella sp.]|nr:efflux RND transporter periplasmic adaptor subunit [Alloprevotella sp.]
MKKLLKWVFIVLAAFIFIMTFVFLYKRSQPKEIVYETITAETRTIERTSIVTGTIEPRNEVNIKPQISGIISELLHEAGDKVNAGDIIARVKVIPDMAQLSSTENRVRLSKINLDQAKKEFEREQNLFNEKLVSAEEYEKSRQTYLQAKEEVSAAQESFEIAKNGVSSRQKDVGSTLVRSTVSGLILDVPVKVGTSVIMSNSFNDGTTIATVANMNDLIFKGSIDETEVARLKPGMPMIIRIGALQDQTFSATLEYVAPQVTSGTTAANQFEIKAAVKLSNDITIRAGYSANAEIVINRQSDVCSVPEGCVSHEDGKNYVYVLTKSAPQTYERREVTTGLSDGIHIEVKSGLKPGEKVRGNVLTQ